MSDAEAARIPPGRTEAGVPGGGALDAARWRRWATPERWAVVLALVPAVSAVAVLGRLHPDEVYQFLEPAFARVHGYGVLAWEWKQGLRNWAVPLVLAAVLRVGAWLGLTDPWVARGLLAVPLWALQAWGLVAAARLGRRRAGVLGGWVTVFALGCLPLFVVVAGRTLGEALSAALLLVAAEALSREEPPQRSGLLGGAALGLAFVARYGSLPAMAAALAWVAARRRWELLAWAAAGLGAVLLVLGALDWASWGTPWHSVGAWFAFNVGSGGAARTFGAEPPGYYWPFLWKQVPLWVWPALALGVAWLRPRLGVAAAMAALMLLALLQTTHKEERFLYPVEVLLVVEAAPGLAALLQRLRAVWQRVGVAAVALLLTVASGRPDRDLRGDQFRAIVKATRPPEVTGLLIVNEGLWGAGGFFYVGKPIPWLTCDWPQDGAFRAAMRDPRFNRVVTFEGRALVELQAAGFRMIGTEGRETILAR
ncbi:MAG TPA: mannosyltransferase [Myxococcaceae bacterium]|nr:mannosyltransferase [Myxococcaceae bacterium]